MKTILLATTLIMADSLSASAQSKFTVANNPATAVYICFGQKVNSVGRDKYWAQLYISPAGGDAGSLAPVATAIGPIGVNAGVANGLFNLGTVTIANLDANQTVMLQVRGWLGSNVSGGYEAAAIRGRNEAKFFTSKTSPPVVAFGIGGLGGFQLALSCVPEPGSLLLLAGLGASVLFCRRK